jgi:prophage regulatory protein
MKLWVGPSMPATVQQETGMRLIRERDRRIKTGVPRSTWYSLMAEGIAPKPVKLGPRSVAWIEDELEAWMRELETKRAPAAR